MSAEHPLQLRGPRSLASADLVSCKRLFGGVAPLLEVVLQFHCTVKDADDVDFVFVRLQIHDSISSQSKIRLSRPD
jgi:hypothetical protein